jgi:hypothetical protein
VSDDGTQLPPHDAAASDDPEAYEPPRIEITTDEYQAADGRLAFADGAPGAAPDDTLGEDAAADGPAEVLGWATPEADYIYGDPKLFVAPKQPGRKITGKKKTPRETSQSGKKTVARSSYTRLTTHDTFGALVCTCNKVCTCHMVCTCQAVCSCVAYYAPSGGGSTSTCSCVPVCTCVPVAH